MNVCQRALALVPLMAAAAGCSTLAGGARNFVGLNQEPVRTEGDASTAALGARLRTVRAALDWGITDVVDPNFRERQMFANPPAAVEPAGLADLAELYYVLGRLAMRSQCESYMQALATVDSETTFGRDLANNFFDTATVAATVSQSPVMWATGLSATQNTFNSVSGSTERFLLLTESAGALRERVLERMDDAVGTPPSFKLAEGVARTPASALELARQSIEAVQRYGAPCSEGGIRQIIAEALNSDGLAQQAAHSREQSFTAIIQSIINADVPEGQAGYEVTDDSYRLLYLWTQSRGESAAAETRHVRGQIEHELTYLRELKPQEQRHLSYYVQQVARQRSDISSNTEALRTEVLARRAAREAQAPTEPAPPAKPAPPTEPAPETDE